MTLMLSSTCAEDVRYIPTPLPTSQVIYYQTNTDSTGATLDASSGNNYTITFQLPIPAKFWWSLIIYNASSLNLIDNPINRYSVSDRVSNLLPHDMHAMPLQKASRYVSKGEWTIVSGHKLIGCMLTGLGGNKSCHYPQSLPSRGYILPEISVLRGSQIYPPVPAWC